MMLLVNYEIVKLGSQATAEIQHLRRIYNKICVAQNRRTRLANKENISTVTFCEFLAAMSRT